MGTYKVSTHRIIEDTEMYLMWKALVDRNKKEEAYAISMLWLTGARPAELLDIKRKDILISPDEVLMKVPTKKLQYAREPVPKIRTLKYSRKQQSPYLTYIIHYIQEFSKDKKPEEYMLKWGKRKTIPAHKSSVKRKIRKRGIPQQIVQKEYNIREAVRNTGTKKLQRVIRDITKEVCGELDKNGEKLNLTPYHFRHSAFTQEASKPNVGIAQIMAFKGSASAESVKRYIHARPYVLDR